MSVSLSVCTQLACVIHLSVCPTKWVLLIMSFKARRVGHVTHPAWLAIDCRGGVLLYEHIYCLCHFSCLCFGCCFMFCIINCFSLTERSHAQLPGLYVLQVFRIFHSILSFWPRPSSQIYCHNVVECLLVSSRNEWV